MCVWITWKMGVGKNGSVVYSSHPSFQEVLALWVFVASISFPHFYHCSLFPHFSRCLLLPSGREPSISSDTRTDSSTESYPYKHSHHESVVSHFSSDSQGTVIYNVENDSMSQSSRDTGRDLTQDSACLIQFLYRKSPKKNKLGQVVTSINQYIRQESAEFGQLSRIQRNKILLNEHSWLHCIQECISKDHVI